MILFELVGVCIYTALAITLNRSLLEGLLDARLSEVQVVPCGSFWASRGNLDDDLGGVLLAALHHLVSHRIMSFYFTISVIFFLKKATYTFGRH